MVLLTAVKNFRQYNTKKGSNALSLGDLRCLSVVEHCPGTLSTVAPGKEMEIERYHAAFPALGTAESTGYVQQFDLSSFAGRNEEADELQTHSHLEEISSSEGGSVKSKGSNQRQVKHQNAKDRSGHPNCTKNHHNNHNQARRHATRYQSPKHRKCFRDRNIDLKPTSKTTKKDSKPWKHLEPVEREVCPQAADVVAGAVGEKEWISDDVLQSALTDDVPEDLGIDQERLRSLWTNDRPGDSSLWAFDETKTQTNVFVSAEASTAEVNADDFCSIEASLSRLQVNDEVPGICHGSKLMPLFSEWQFCHMILNAQPAAGDGVHSLSVCPPLSCQHCEEAYEIILDMETSPRSTVTVHPLLSEVDSRLNFDWCKYDPPPWSTANRTEPATDNRQNSRYLCGCEFCQSRMWTKSCRVCGTPLGFA